MLMFAHGFNIQFGQIVPPNDIDVVMIAPKGPGHLVRRQYIAGQRRARPDRSAPGRDRQRAGSWRWHTAHGIGCARGGLIETTFARGDGDRPVRRAGRALRRHDALVQAGFETLVEAGYQPEIAYFECLHELKLIVDLMYEGGMAKMRYSISDTAEYGDLTRRPADRRRQRPRPYARAAPGDPGGPLHRDLITEEARAGRSSWRCAAAPRSARSRRSAPACARWPWTQEPARRRRRRRSLLCQGARRPPVPFAPGSTHARAWLRILARRELSVGYDWRTARCLARSLARRAGRPPATPVNPLAHPAFSGRSAQVTVRHGVRPTGASSTPGPSATPRPITDQI